ncbi:hypothetical protein JCGZ_01855 [Jatropha curcas]|uniref:Uncharacterized protein n=1 Tax=Jatropha curcas TaxID=180498 RepID=A0A067L0W0_JATCU|nr:arabinogalactan protein 13 [Jatropha curcas]KDP42067.1 hypothetical protein JCGZ_01855 [Jatropha curcas]
MEAMKMNLFVVLMVVLMASSNMQMATAVGAPSLAPAPSPASDANVFVPTFFASLVALACGFFF